MNENYIKFLRDRLLKVPLWKRPSFLVSGPCSLQTIEDGEHRVRPFIGEERLYWLDLVDIDTCGRLMFEFVEGYDLNDKTVESTLMFDAPIIRMTGGIANDSLDGFSDYLDVMMATYADRNSEDRLNVEKESIKLKKEIEVLPEVNPLFGSWS